MWKHLAKLLARPAMTSWLIRRAKKTPYLHIMKGDDVYMERYWLFNPYDKVQKSRWRGWLPSVRLHWIRQPDQDRHLHSHPWDCRTIILRGEYTERRIARATLQEPNWNKTLTEMCTRRPGDTATLDINDYHAIESISEGGVWTMFITWKYQGTWGFLVNGKKVPYKKYLGL